MISRSLVAVAAVITLSAAAASTQAFAVDNAPEVAAFVATFAAPQPAGQPAPGARN